MSERILAGWTSDFSLESQTQRHFALYITKQGKIGVKLKLLMFNVLNYVNLFVAIMYLKVQEINI